MPLVLAIKNRDTIVVASDTDGAPRVVSEFGQCIQLPNRAVLLIAGNLEAVRQTVVGTVLPKVHPQLSAAGLAQILNAALVLEVVPRLPQITGRIELIVAGIDPVRHIEQTSLYYLDSAQDFYIRLVAGDAVAAGSTALTADLLEGPSFAAATVDQLQATAKECLTATKLRWPTALGNHLRLGVITGQNMRFQDF